MNNTWSHMVLTRSAILAALAGVIGFVSAKERCITSGTPVFPVVEFCDSGCCGEQYNGNCCPESHAAGIVGGVLGGVLFVSLVIAVLCWYLLKQKQDRTVEPGDTRDTCTIIKDHNFGYTTTSLWYPAVPISQLERQDSPTETPTDQGTSDSELIQ